MSGTAAKILEVGAFAERRGDPRRVLKLGYDAAAAGGKRVEILGLSRSGMLIETTARLSKGEVIEVELPGAGLVHCTVERCEGSRYATSFSSRISQAVVSAVVLGAPAVPGDAMEAAPSVADRTSPSEKRGYDGFKIAVWFLSVLASLLAWTAIAFGAWQLVN